MVKEVKLVAQSCHIWIYQYYWLKWSKNKKTSHLHTQSLLTLLKELGWIVDMQKSAVVGQQVFNFVDYQYDLRQGLVTPTPQMEGPEFKNRNSAKIISAWVTVHICNRPAHGHGKTSSLRPFAHEAHTMTPKGKLACPRVF